MGKTSRKKYTPEFKAHGAHEIINSEKVTIHPQRVAIGLLIPQVQGEH